MAFGSGANSRFAYIAEVTPGTTPTTPTFKVMRVTGGGLRNNKGTTVSDEIRQDRNVTDELMVSLGAGGSYPFELSYGSFDDMIEAVLFSTWSANVCKNGLTRKFFTFEDTIELGATDSFSRYTMGMVNRFSLDIQANSKITGSIEIRGKKEELASAIISGATYTAVNSNTIMTSGASVAGISIHGLSPVPKVRSVSLEINNNLRDRPILGQLWSEEFGEGRCEVTGTIEAYFETSALYQKVLDHATGSISITLGQTTAEKYTILIPSAVFLDGARQIGGNNDDVIATVPFRGVYNASEAASIKFTRAVV